MRTTRIWLAAALASILVSTAPMAFSNEAVRKLEWEELMPKGWNPFEKLEALRTPKQGELTDGSEEADRLMREYRAALASAPTVPELDGARVQIPGFVVPLDYTGTEVKQFLLVPYFGACIHTPPPPSNQIVFVKAAQAYSLKEMFDPVSVTGRLRTQAHLHEVGDAGYTLEATKIEPYE